MKNQPIKIFYLSTLAILVLTILGILFKSRALIVFLALIISSIFFLLFLFINQILIIAHSKNYDEVIWGLDISSLRPLVNKFKIFPQNLAILLRTFFLLFGMLFIDIYSAICSKLFASSMIDLINNIQITLLISIPLFTIAILDTIKGFTLEAPEKSTRYLSIFGFFQFIKNYFFLMFSNAISADKFDYYQEFFTNYFWYLDLNIITNIINTIIAPYPFKSIIFFFILLPIYVRAALKWIRNYTSPDIKNFCWGSIWAAIWFWILPACMLVLLLIRLVEN
jgi:hypothetical protein